MAFAQIPSYEPLDTKSEGVATRWAKWVSRLENNLFVAYGITDEARKKALMLTYGGSDLNDIVENLPESEITPLQGQSPFTKLVEALNKYFNPTVNREIQKYSFRHLYQKSENIEDFYIELKRLASTCEFTNSDEEIKSQMIAGCKSSKVREKGLSNPKLSLQELLQYARTCQLTQKHAKDVEHHVDQASALHKKSAKAKGGKFSPHSHKMNNRGPQPKKTAKCRNCGLSWPHTGGQRNCPAFNKTCHTCGKQNHFSSMCENKELGRSHGQNNRHNRGQRNSHVRNVRLPSPDSSDSGDEYVFVSSSKSRDVPLFEVTINGKKIQALADSGASVNILPADVFHSLNPKPQLESCFANIFPFSSSSPLKVMGKFKAQVSCSATTQAVDFIVVKTKEIPILGWRTCQELQLLRQLNTLKDGSMQSKFPDVFSGLGKLKDVKIKLHIDTSVQPVAQRYRRIPFHLRKQLDEHLDSEEKLGVIEKATGATPWVSPLVIVPKPKSPNKIRVCVDMRAPNTAIRRERHNTPTLDELTATLSGATLFSKLDLNQGYNQLELDEESRYITTFATHKGLYRFKRLNFGVNSAAEIFQEAIRQTLNGLPGVINVSDDILVYGTDIQDHNQNLKKVLQRLSERNLTLNSSKCQFKKISIEFLGHIFSAEGIKPCPNKLKDIIEMDPPKNVSEVRSLLGMMNFCGARFIPDYTTLTYELRKLTKKNTKFTWTEKHDDVLQRLKTKLQESLNLAYFDSTKDTQIYVDASPVGISAILTQSKNDQPDKVVQFASRALTETEQRYSQTEREALAVTWACEHFHIYLLGSPMFTVFTDHKPLVSLFGNPKTQLPARIERWVMRTQAYRMNIVYKPGKDNPADYMSRHPNKLNKPSSREQKVAEEYIQFVTNNSVPKAMTLDEVATETDKDPTLQALIKSLETNEWNKNKAEVPCEQMKAFETLKQCATELSITENGIVLKGRQIVLPASLQSKAVDIAHSGHQGQTKTLALLREKVWFQSMSSAAERAVKNCLACQIATPCTTREPLQMSVLPSKPWSELSADFGHLPNGKYMLVVTDEYSRYVLVDVVKTTSARAIIPKLDKMFAEFGLPDRLKTDNGPPFSSWEFKKYMMNMGIKHHKITPLWPRANGETERFMRTIKKSIKAAHAEHKNWKQEMFKFLLSYRATPHSSTGLSPAQVLFGRNLKTKLPEPPLSVQRPIDSTIQQNDSEAKARMKFHADKKIYVKPSNLEIGDSVLVKDTTSIRPPTPYERTPYTVTAKKGSMVTASRSGKSITRNSSFFKKSPRPPTSSELQEEEAEKSDPEQDNELEERTTPKEPQLDIPQLDTPQQLDIPQDRPRRQRKHPKRFEDFIMKS